MTLDDGLIATHLLALAAWAVSGALGHWRTGQARAADPARALQLHRSLRPWLIVEHASLAAALAAGGILMLTRGWGLGHARWLAAKLGLVAFLIVPLEAMHAYICHVWIARGLAQTEAPPFSRDLERGLGMDEMLRALGVPLLALGLPLLLWLSILKAL